MKNLVLVIGATIIVMAQGFAQVISHYESKNFNITMYSENEVCDSSFTESWSIGFDDTITGKEAWYTLKKPENIIYTEFSVKEYGQELKVLGETTGDDIMHETYVMEVEPSIKESLEDNGMLIANLIFKDTSGNYCSINLFIE